MPMKVPVLAIACIAICSSAWGQNIFGVGERGPNKPGPIQRTADGKPNLEGFWITQSNSAPYGVEEHASQFGAFGGKSIVVDPQDGKIPYQGWARAKQQDLQLHHMYDEPEAHCSQSGVPHQVWTQFGFQILQPRGYVVMLWEFMHGNRIIALDGRPHIDPKIKLTQGDSIGHWEGDTLVIDTTNLNDKTWLDATGNFHSDAEHVVERFTPVDSDTIDYQATIEDPRVYYRKWTVGLQIWRNPDPHYEQMEFACREGNVDLEHYTDKGK
ncbi:MAG: hypothetical protein ACLPWF_24870 [Bryobacteraceae bacterium]